MFNLQGIQKTFPKPNKKNKYFNNHSYLLFFNLSEVSVIDSRYIKMTELQDFHRTLLEGATESVL